MVTALPKLHAASHVHPSPPDPAAAMIVSLAKAAPNVHGFLRTTVDALPNASHFN